MRTAIYIRVSSVEQNSALQREELAQYVQARGWTVIETFEDTMSGAKSARPGLNRLLADAAARKFDAVIVWKLDRFGRSLVDCLSHIQTLERHGVRFLSVTQGLDTNQNDPAGRFLLHILGAAAEFERSLIRERVHAGIKAAKKAGKALGRPKRVFDRAAVHELRAQGLSIRDISKRLEVGIGTVTRTLAEAA
jgi:DNA invertase Pin-like site-specific DNA recombinase